MSPKDAQDPDTYRRHFVIFWPEVVKILGSAHNQYSPDRDAYLISFMPSHLKAIFEAVNQD
jgi:hypothetical protein